MDDDIITNDENQRVDPQVQAEFMTAIENENIDRVRTFLQQRTIALHEPDNNENFPLDIAIETDNTELVQMLLGAGADPNYDDGEEKGPMQTAILNGNVEMVKALIPKVNNLEIYGEDDLSLVAMAACLETDEILKALLDAGANINEVDNENNNQTALHAIVKYDCDEQAITHLINNGADINLQDSTGETALSLVMKNEFVNFDWGPECAAMVLLDAGADPNLYPARDRSPLFYAIFNQGTDKALIDLALAFIDKGANADIDVETLTREWDLLSTLEITEMQEEIVDTTKSWEKVKSIGKIRAEGQYLKLASTTLANQINEGDNSTPTVDKKKAINIVLRNQFGQHEEKPRFSKDDFMTAMNQKEGETKPSNIRENERQVNEEQTPRTRPRLK